MDIWAMVLFDQLRVCKNCGNVFSKKAGVTNISECPQCKGTNFEQIVFQTKSEDEKMYLNEDG